MTETLDRTDEAADMFNPDGTDAPVDPHAAFWEQRPVLQHIRDFARARRAGPFAVLGVTLARVVATIEPPVVLPPEIGTEVGLNLFVALCGQSGAGKGAGEGAAVAAVRFVDHNGQEIEIASPNIGSGEGLAKIFVKPVDDDDDGGGGQVTRAVVSVPEIGTLAALAGRQGSTLNGEILKVYMGEPIGFNNASAATTSAVGRHAYRLCLIVGVQPQNANVLLDSAKDGLPQRFQWLRVTDPYAPRIKPDLPEQWTVKRAKWNTGTELQHIIIPEIARKTIDDHRYRVLIGEPVDPLDSHRLLAREKIAAALMLLDGRSVMNNEDWEIAGQILEISDETRADMEKVLADQKKRANRARATADGERAVIVAGIESEGGMRRAAEAVLRKLGRAGGCTEAELRRSVAADIRGNFGAAFGQLVDDGQIRRVAGPGDPPRYELS